MLEILIASHIVSVRSLPSYCRYDKVDRIVVCVVSNIERFCFAQRPGCAYERHRPCVVFLQRGVMRGSRVYAHELDHCRGMRHD
jgi:hypothetical protein